MFHLIGQLIVGLIVGVIARLLMPGREAFPAGGVRMAVDGPTRHCRRVARRLDSYVIVGGRELYGRMDNVHRGSDSSAADRPAYFLDAEVRPPRLKSRYTRQQKRR